MATESLHPFKDILIVLGTAGVVIPLLKRFGVSAIIGFMLTGLVLGPHILGRIAESLPFLEPFTLAEVEGFSGLAELGVVFLLFLIGLELSPERLLTMRKLIFGFGGLQVMLTTALLAFLAALFGYATREALVIGAALSLSSTAIIIQLFSDQKRLGSQAGRISFAVLLLQDLAVIPMLLMVTALGNTSSTSIIADIAKAFGQAAIAALLIVIVGRFALTPLLRLVASAKSHDLFMAAVLFIALGTGALATWAGLSMSIGAFITGIMLAETEYRRAIEAIIEPFKGLLLGVFFLLVGLSIDLGLVAQSPGTVLLGAIVVIALKALVIFGLSLLFRLPRQSAFEASLLLAPGGEFAFVLLSAAIAQGMFANDGEKILLPIVSLSMIAIPLLGWIGRSYRGNIKRAANPIPDIPSPDANEKPKVIIAGFGRVGTLVADLLKGENISYAAVDFDIGNVSTARKKNYNVYFGDASLDEFLLSCGLATATSLAITMDSTARTDEILRVARKLKPDLKIIVRARDERHAMKLYEAGATEAVPETIEASLQLGEALLVATGVPMGLAIAAVHESRDGFRKRLGTPNRREEVAQARKRLRDRLDKPV